MRVRRVWANHMTETAASPKRLPLPLPQISLVAISVVLLAATAFAQGTTNTSPSLPVYDAATIRLNNSGTGDSDVWVELTTFRTKNVALKELLQMAFNVRRSQISGIPDWAEKARFDINAKITDPDIPALKKLTSDQQRLILQRFFAEKFALKWHRESRSLPVYELVVVKGGPKFDEGPHCTADSDSTSQSNTDLTAKCVRMRTFSDLLSNQMDRPVVDKTGLAAHYDFHLRWSRDEAKAEAASNGSDADTPPSLFTALEEQLGLKLVAGKDPVDTLVVDSIDKPAEN